MFIPQLGKYAESILENGSSSGRKLAKLQAIGRQAVAALCALGGFKETIKIGSEVQVSETRQKTSPACILTCATVSILDRILHCGVIFSINSIDWLIYCDTSALQVIGRGVLGSVGIVMSINEQEGIATVKFPSCEYRRTCKVSDILAVPISRLCTPRSEARISVTVHSLFFWENGNLMLTPVHSCLPSLTGPTSV